MTKFMELISNKIGDYNYLIKLWRKYKLKVKKAQNRVTLLDAKLVGMLTTSMLDALKIKVCEKYTKVYLFEPPSSQGGEWQPVPQEEIKTVNYDTWA